jgi:large subunit ribosomal protein L13
MQKTTMITTAQAKHNRKLVDAKNQVLGRFATQIAQKLMGKHKADYTPHIDAGDFVVVINASEIAITGTKNMKKIYFSFSGFPSGLSKANFSEVMRKNPDRILREAVKRMLPDNRLRDGRLSRLKIFAGAEHKHESQVAQQQ